MASASKLTLSMNLHEGQVLVTALRASWRANRASLDATGIDRLKAQQEMLTIESILRALGEEADPKVD